MRAYAAHAVRKPSATRRSGAKQAKARHGAQDLRGGPPRRTHFARRAKFSRLAAGARGRISSADHMEEPMRILLSSSIVSAVVLMGALGLAQTPAGPGFHAVSLPKRSAGAQSIQSNVLLETPHLKLVTITVPKGGSLAAHAAPDSVSVQALAGSGQIILAGRSETIDSGRAIVLAPNVQHEVRASGGADLVLLVHHLRAGRCGVGPGAGRGMGRGRGPGANAAPAPSP